MKLKPRFHILFFIYLIFGGTIIGLLVYLFSYKIGESTELAYETIVKTKFADTIVAIKDLSPKDYAYPHGGKAEYLELKNNKEFIIPLYLVSYNKIEKIKPGTKISKDINSHILKIRNENQSFNIELLNLKDLRKQKGKIERIKWIIVYVIIGVIIMFVPINKTQRN